MKLNVDVLLWSLGKCPERYVPKGYFDDDIGLDKSLEIFESIKGLDGVYLFYPEKESTDPEWWLKKLGNHNLEVSNIAFDIWSDKRWKYGSISSSESKIRKEAIKMAKEAVDFAKATKAYSMLIWPAHDGFDYVFQSSYGDAWKYIIESLKEVCDYANGFKVCIEPKPKDPRQKSFISDTGKMLYLINEVGYSNLGAALDTGHVLLANESLAESVVLLNKTDKIHQVHLNENYRDADPDLLFGTINFWEILEFFYFLNKTNYNGWCLADIITQREDRIKALKLSVKMIYDYRNLADRIMKFENQIDENLKKNRYLDNFELLRELIFK